MTSSSKNNADALKPIQMETHDDRKYLVLHPIGTNPYTQDPCFRMEFSSATVRANGPFQVSAQQLETFFQSWDSDQHGEIHDENGDGKILLETIDTLGHFKVTAQIGGVWSDQAQISFESDQTAVLPFVEQLRHSFRL